MAKSKKSLIKEGKDLGLNLTEKMSIYELEHRIAEKKLELEKLNKGEKKSSKKEINGEY